MPLDTYHLMRTLRPIPMGEKNWLFASMQAGAGNVAVLPTLLFTARLQHINHFGDLVDVL